MKTYEEIKSELVEIAKVLKIYPEAIQPKVFEILTKHFLGHTPIPHQANSEEQIANTTEPSLNKTTKSKSNSKSVGKSKENLTLLKDLDLRPSGNKSFKDLFEEKNPGAAFEFNAVAVYYLAEILALTNITSNHIYTCYKEVSKRPPGAFVQSLRDTASRYGYIDTSDINNIKIPLRGKTYVEHDLPKQKSKK